MQVNRLIGHREAYEDHAADFMDDLFGEVEQSLRMHRERTRRLEPQEDEPEQTVVSLVKVDMDSIRLPIMPEISPTWIETAPPMREAAIPAMVIPEQSSGLDKFFLGTALASMLLGASVVLVHYAMLQRSLISGTAPVPAPTETSAPPVSPQSLDFSSEIKTALQTATPPQPSAANPIAPSTPVASTPTSPQTIVQYVPLFSPPPAAPPTYNSPQPITSTAPSPAAKPLPAESGPAPIITAPSTPRLPAPPENVVVPVPTVVAAKPSAPKVIEPEVTPLTGSSTGSTLSGLFMLEPNSRSYALVESNGTVQSIPIGSAVGGTGWKLKRVTQQTAVLERNGIARSVAVGQKF